MSAPDIRAMEDMLDHLRAKKALAEEQLRASTSKNPELAWDVRRIEGRIQLLEEMLDDQRRGQRRGPSPRALIDAGSTA